MTRKRKIIIGSLLGLVVLIGGGVAASALRGDTPPETIRVERATVVNDIDFSGRLQAKQAADLGFESTGKLSRLLVTVGDSVVEGQVLATQETSVAALELAKARADHAGAAASAAVELQNAATAAKTTQAAAARTVETARQSVRNAKTEYDQAKVVWDKTVRESGDSSLTEAKYSVVLSALSAYRGSQATLKQAEKEAQKTTTAAAAAVASASVAVQNIEQTSPTTAGLSALAAAEQLAVVRLGKQTIRAPFDGVVTDTQFIVGELATAGSTVLTIQTAQTLEVVAQVAETDVALLAAGMPVRVAFDALPDQDWPGSIATINPAAVILEGVPTYEVVVNLNEFDNRLKPGLSATISVRVSEKTNVLVVPRRAVSTVNGTKQVRVVAPDSSISTRDVKTGVQGSDGSIEITDGLAEGDTVVVRQP